MTKKLFKYYPEDFGKLNVKVHHMDLIFDMYAKKTNVHSTIFLESLEDLKEIVLNAKDLEIHEIISDFSKVTYKYDKEKDLIIIKFSKKILKGTKFSITTKSSCYPTNNILEGLYYDETPKGCPCQMITQCQQWGFQRIVPCIDDMTAKCTYTTIIRASKDYTNYITNGDIIKKLKPISKTRVEIKYENIKTPMATYLFFLGVGTYKTFKREFEYPNGDTFMLELLVPPKSDKLASNRALKVLHDAIMWVYLFTGPNKYKNESISREILKLVEKREKLKLENNSGQKLKSIREKLNKLSQNKIFGYKYTGTIYREIGMQNTDFGGMENVGNTTISTNRIMPFKDMVDSVFEYMIRVKVHEYYHNLNGSEVTGKSPFEIWLNEAVTVHIEREYLEFLQGYDYGRLSNVIQIISPGNGVLANDSGVQSIPILPVGFNSPNDLITGITYVKAPEFVRMIQKTLGDEKFVLALNDYHSKFKHSNATTKDWISSMQHYSDRNLTKMSKMWLNEPKFPIIEVKEDFNRKDKKITLLFTQINATKTKFWSFPFKLAIFKDSKKLKEIDLFIESKEQKIEISGIKDYSFISLNRGFSAYSKIKYFPSIDALNSQINYDDDFISRFMALQTRYDFVKKEQYDNPTKVVDKDFLKLYFTLLTDKKIFQKTGGLFFTLFENIDDERYSFDFKKIYDIKNKIFKEFASLYEKKLFKLYQKFNINKKDNEFTFPGNELNNLRYRQVKNLILSILAKLDNERVHDLIKTQFKESTNATDKYLAFRLYIESSIKDKEKVLQQFKKECKKNLVSWEMFLSIIATNNSENPIKLIKDIEKDNSFKIEQSNDQRALLISFALNKKISLQTQEGRDYLKQIIIKLTKINEYTTSRLFSIFGNLDLMKVEDQVTLVSLLKEVQSKIDSKKHAIVYNTIERILVKSPISIKNWEIKTA